MRWSNPFRRADIVVAAAAVLFILGSPAVSRAVVAGSKHDFSDTPIATGGGTCSPCHAAHNAPEALGIWNRPLTNADLKDDERGYFAQDGTPSPDYIPYSTILCYDCHEGRQRAPIRTRPRRGSTS